MHDNVPRTGDWIETCVLTMTLCITGCTVRGKAGNNDSSDGKEPVKPDICTTTNINAAMQLFPSLEGVEAVEMEQLKYGGSSSPRSLPAPVELDGNILLFSIDNSGGLPPLS